jgi:hypothetical protein
MTPAGSQTLEPVTMALTPSGSRRLSLVLARIAIFSEHHSDRSAIRQATRT